MENIPFQYLGYTPLFLVSVMTQIVVPFPLDLIVLSMFALNFSPLLIIILATSGLTIGASLTFIIGKGGLRLFKSFRKLEKTKKFYQAKKLYQKFGKWTLLVTFLPGVGKYFALFAGIMGLNWLTFLTLFITGRLVYYTVLYFLFKSIWASFIP